MGNENNNEVISSPVETDAADSHYVIKIPRNGLKTFLKFAVPCLLVISLAMNVALLRMRSNYHYDAASVIIQREHLEKIEAPETLEPETPETFFYGTRPPRGDRSGRSGSFYFGSSNKDKSGKSGSFYFWGGGK